MGFFDSFSTSVGGFFTGVGDFVNTFAQTPVGTRLIDRGINELFDVIGGFDTSGPSSRGGLPGPQGSPVPGGITNLQAASYCAGRLPSAQIPGTPWTCGSLGTGTPAPQRGSIVFPRLDQGPLPTRGQFQPQRPTVGLPAIPSSQPVDTRFATFTPGGNQVPAFPINTFQGFPPSPTNFANLIGGGGPGFQNVGLTSLLPTIAKQLPGFVGGIIGGNLLENVFSGGGGGSVTPMFRPTMAGVRAQSFRATNPVTGQDVFFRPAGKPILWSSDLSACKRVNKVARRARRKR